MIHPFVNAICVFLAITLSCPAQTSDRTDLFPQKARPQRATRTVKSVDKRVGDQFYQVFYFRKEPKHEAFRIQIGFYDKGQLVSDWFYGIVLEKDTNSDGKLDYVWYGGDDTGQRLLWFLSKNNGYECVDIYKSAEAAWQRRFKKAPPDLGEVGGENMAANVVWNRASRLLTVTVDSNSQDLSKVQKIYLNFGSGDFVNCDR